MSNDDNWKACFVRFKNIFFLVAKQKKAPKLFILFFLKEDSQGAMQGEIFYTLSMPRPNTHYFEVSIAVNGPFVEGNVLRVAMPVWTPGSYLLREFSRNVMGLKAQDSKTSKPLKCEKESKDTWKVETGDASEITVSYKVYAFEYTVDTSFLDTRHGVVNGASVFMYVRGREGEKHVLKVTPFKEWKVISTSLERTVEGNYTAKNYDILIDSPIEIGNQRVESFLVSGVTHEVSMYGPSTIDIAGFVLDLKKIVENSWQVFGEIPYKRYLFLIDFVGAATGGGLEHLNSTHCIVPRMRLYPFQEYRALLSLFSHEFFHVWNVKRMRPKGLGPFDYTREVYTNSLWIAEGITSYYDDLILRRAGIYSVPEYLDAFSVNVNFMKSLPSFRFESAKEASFDTWIKHYRPDENTPNAQSSYYVQGSIIGWMLDMEIRKSTKNAKTLDDVMRAVYKETYASKDAGYTEEEFEEACNKIAGIDLSRTIFDTRVRGREQVDYAHFLSYAGLTLGPKSKDAKPKGYLGLKLRSEGGRATVSSRLFDTPAEASGIAAGDEIIAIDNLRMDSSLASHYISNKSAGDTITVLISRDGYLETREAKIAVAPNFEWRVYKEESANEAQKDFFKAWLLADWNAPLEYSEYAPSPQKPRPFEYI